MGYYFTGVNSNYVAGIKNDSDYILMRSDIASKKINKYYEKIVPSALTSTTCHMFYPHGIISQSEAKKYGQSYGFDALNWERAAYEKFRTELTQDIVNFKMSDLKVPGEERYDFVSEMLKIFLHGSSKLDYELSNGILRVSKTSRIIKFFGATVDTIVMHPISDIHDVHISEDLLSFFNKKKVNIFSIGRSDCYVIPRG